MNAILVNYDSVSRGRLNAQATRERGKLRQEMGVFSVGYTEGILGVRGKAKAKRLFG